MIRPITFVTLLAALSSGAWMFVVKHQAEQLDHRIGGVTGQIRAAEQRTRVLRAEWALETDPNRLARLATLFLPTLKPMVPDQMVTWSQLADRLPPPGATIPHLPLPPPLPDQLPDNVPGPIAANTLPLPPPMPAQPQRAAARPIPSIRRVALPVPRHAVPNIHHPVTHLATAHPIPLGRSVLAPVPRVSAQRIRPMGAQVMTINAQTTPQTTPQTMPRPAPVPVRQRTQTAASTSVFGGYAANLAPPRPVDAP